MVNMGTGEHTGSRAWRQSRVFLRRAIGANEAFVIY
jgi:hypothetical protein